jgi:hypothetical protein
MRVLNVCYLNFLNILIIKYLPLVFFLSVGYVQPANAS